MARIATREWLNKHPLATTTFAVVASAISLAIVLLPRSINCFPMRAWFAIEGTQELIVIDGGMSLIPPVERDGRRLVKAHVYGCGDCNENNTFVGYYEKYTDEAKAELARLEAAFAELARLDAAFQDGGSAAEFDERMFEVAKAGRFCSTDGKTWVLAESAEGQAIQEQVKRRCADRKLVMCFPD